MERERNGKKRQGKHMTAPNEVLLLAASPLLPLHLLGILFHLKKRYAKIFYRSRKLIHWVLSAPWLRRYSILVEREKAVARRKIFSSV